MCANSFAILCDRDGHMDVAAASFLSNKVVWFENLGAANLSMWQARTVDSSVGKAHYVFAADVDGDSDLDLIASGNGDNTVTVFFASTACDDGEEGAACCSAGSEWNGTACILCLSGSLEGAHFSRSTL